MFVRLAVDGKTFLCSGIIRAEVVLPKGIDVAVNATGVWPDLLVYDGAFDETEQDEDEPKREHEMNDEGDDRGVHWPHSYPPKTPHPHLPDWQWDGELPLPHLPPVPWKRPRLPGDHEDDGKGGEGGNHQGHHHEDEKRPPPHRPAHQPDSDHEEPPPPLPDPLPLRAFARIRPDVWLPATTHPIDEDSQRHWRWLPSLPPLGKGDGEDDGEQDGGWRGVVKANIHDVPLQVLPGRDALFRGFISKVRGGAIPIFNNRN